MGAIPPPAGDETPPLPASTPPVSPREPPRVGWGGDPHYFPPLPASISLQNQAGKAEGGHPAFFLASFSREGKALGHPQPTASARTPRPTPQALQILGGHSLLSPHHRPTHVYSTHRHSPPLKPSPHRLIEQEHPAPIGTALPALHPHPGAPPILHLSFPCRTNQHCSQLAPAPRLYIVPWLRMRQLGSQLIPPVTVFSSRAANSPAYLGTPNARTPRPVSATAAPHLHTDSLKSSYFIFAVAFLFLKRGGRENCHKSNETECGGHRSLLCSPCHYLRAYYLYMRPIYKTHVPPPRCPRPRFVGLCPPFALRKTETCSAAARFPLHGPPNALQKRSLPGET